MDSLQHKKTQQKWYSILPWWGWIISIIVSSQLSSLLAKSFTGLISAMLAAGLAFFMLYSIVALIAWLCTIPSRRRTATRAKHAPPTQAPMANNTETQVTQKRHQMEHSYLEKKRSWRIAKVAFWIAILLAVLYFLLYQDEYGRSNLQGVALFIVLICFPLYLLYKKVVYYIVSGE